MTKELQNKLEMMLASCIVVEVKLALEIMRVEKSVSSDDVFNFHDYFMDITWPEDPWDELWMQLKEMSHIIAEKTDEERLNKTNYGENKERFYTGKRRRPRKRAANG